MQKNSGVHSIALQKLFCSKEANTSASIVVFPGDQVEHDARPLEGERRDGGGASLEGVAAVPLERDLHLLRGDPPLQRDYLI